MSQQDNSTSAAFMEVISRKVEESDKKIAAVEEKIKEAISDNIIKKLSADMAELHTNLKSIPVLPEKMEQLSTRLGIAVQLLQQPIPHKVIHHHYIPKLIWITAGLFLILCLACSGWYITSSKYDDLIANDTKYRKLRLDTAHKSLQLYLDRLDSLYAVMPDMREKVVDAEEERRLNFDRLEKAKRLKAEAKNLEKAAGRK